MTVLDYLPVVFHEWLAQPERILFVAELEGKIVGTEFIYLWMKAKPQLEAPGESIPDTEAENWVPN